MVTDVLDGFLVRRLGQTSKLGVLLDPLTDKLFVVFVPGEQSSQPSSVKEPTALLEGLGQVPVASPQDRETSPETFGNDSLCLRDRESMLPQNHDGGEGIILRQTRVNLLPGLLGYIRGLSHMEPQKSYVSQFQS